MSWKLPFLGKADNKNDNNISDEISFYSMLINVSYSY